MARSLPKVCPFLVTVDLKLKWPELPRPTLDCRICPTQSEASLSSLAAIWQVLNTKLIAIYACCSTPNF